MLTILKELGSYEKFHIDDALEELNNNTKRKPGQSETEAIADSANDMLQRQYDAASPAERKIMMAGAYLGNYLRYARGYSSYCGDLGVDVNNFADQYKQRHSQYYAWAEAQMTLAGVPIDQLWGQLRPAAHNMIDIEINSLPHYKTIVRS